MSDEELQDKIEKGFIGDSLDDTAYRRVFDTLKKEPSFQVPANFAANVIRSMQPAQPTQSRDIFWMVTGVFAFTIVAGISMVLTEFKFDFGELRFISSYSGLIIFGIVFILALQWIDKRLIKGAAFN